MAAAGESLRGATLAGLGLAGLRCIGLDLAGTNWGKADLRGATFTEVDLTGASMDEVVARGVVFADSTMLNLTMRRADLAGAVFRGCEMGGADLVAANLNGAEFEDVRYSQTGGRHTDALALALSALGGEGLSISRAMAAGLAGDPFAFVYNPADLGDRPARPFAQNPLRAAISAAGHDVEALYDLPSAKALGTLTRSLKANKPCLLPISLAATGLSGTDFDKPFWAAAVMVNEVEKPARIVLLVPPFGEREFSAADLAARWEGPFETLEPAGVERSEARFPLLILSQGDSARPPRDSVLAALRNALAIINQQRSYGTLYAGLRGFDRLADDLASAAEATDLQLAAPLSRWDGAPRRLLITARREAAEFLEQASGFMLEAERPALARAAALFRSEAKLLADRFPSLQSNGSTTVEQVRANYVSAAGIVREAADLEAAAARLMAEVAGDTY